MSVPLYEVKIRRDANTITPVSIPEYEIPILKEIVGHENVQTIDGKLIDEMGLGNPVGVFKTSEDEYGRLCLKYGAEIVEGVYGKKSTSTLNSAVSEAVKGKAGRSGAAARQ